MNIRFLILSLLFGIPHYFANATTLEEAFRNPPNSARPGVYWYFMDGNLSREGMTADLESMKKAGLGNLVFLEVNVGVPTGPVKFMSEDWQDLFAHAVHEAERLDIDITLGSGPGWTGSGGPWVKAEHSMQHLVFSEVETTGPKKFNEVLPIPKQRSTTWHKMRSDFYEDVMVYAFPRCEPLINDIDEKALYERDPYTSKKGVKPYLPAPAQYHEPELTDVISVKDMIDLTILLDKDGRLSWEVPKGDWTIVRMGRRSTGASTRPAPEPAVGFECDKFDAAAFDDHFNNFIGKLLKKVGPRKNSHGWTTLHMDSWEMGAQNWTPNFREEFQKIRGYDPMPYFPSYTGRVVESMEITERFLWDIRMTAQDLVLEHYVKRLKDLGRQNDFELSIEPYDMNPTADLDLGSYADVPMAEFWSDGYGFDSSFSCLESSSIAHTMGRSIVSAEVFTADSNEGWKQYPGSMKNQGDWAFCMGINRFVYHTFAHQPLGDEHRPGMTMGPYGVHWDRGQTWWSMVNEYHRYIARVSHLLRQGVAVSDILYLTPEGAPHVFRPPSSALEGSGPLADKKGYSFDGCSPNILISKAKVHNGKIAFPEGTSYQLMILPQFETMTPELLAKIEELVKDGATVVGSPPVKSPSLSNYPVCDTEIQSQATKLWGSLETPQKLTKHTFGQGTIYWGGKHSDSLYPYYDDTVAILKKQDVLEDFSATGPIRYVHRQTEERDIYFISNKSDQLVQADCTFRISKSQPELWNPVNGERRVLPQFNSNNRQTVIPIEFAPYESFFVIFSRNNLVNDNIQNENQVNFTKMISLVSLDGLWNVSFDPYWGGTENITFDTLQDWAQNKLEGIKYYSGIATYRKTFSRPAGVPADSNLYLDLGIVHDIARVRINGKEQGVVWTSPWRLNISSELFATGNTLEIDVANRWVNRLIGDRQNGNADIRTVQWDSGFLDGKPFKTGRYTFAAKHFYKKESQLLPSGLLGPVKIVVQ